MKRIAVVIGVICAALSFAAPAWANHPEASGTTKCVIDEHVITWTIGESHARMTMTIDSATVVLDTTTYSVDLNSNKATQSQPATGVTSIPGNLTGTAKLTAAVSWPSDRTLSVSASVDLGRPCTDVTTTTTTQPPSTTTSTTQPSTTSSGETTTVPVTTPPGPGPCGSPGQLACTGSADTLPMSLIGGGAAVAGGGLWLLRKRPSL